MARTPAGKPKHVRAASELPCSTLRDVVLQSPELKVPVSRINDSFAPTSPSATLVSQHPDSVQTSYFNEQRMEIEKQKEKPSVPKNYDEEAEWEAGSKETGQQKHQRMTGACMNTEDTFLDIEEDRVNRTGEIDESSANIHRESSGEQGLSFDALVDRLVAQPTSKSDEKFAAIFLCLYRKFAAPTELFSAILNRFHLLNDSKHAQTLRTASQLRLLAILAQWVSDYPGDFAHSHTRRMVSAFALSLSGNRAFAVAGKEIGLCLETVSEDDDTDWACSDTSRSRANTSESFLSMSSVGSNASTLNTDSSTEDISTTPGTDLQSKQQQARKSATASVSSSVGRSESQSTGSFQTLLNSVENAQRQAQLLKPIPKHALTKIQWHQLLDTADEDVARELTRIDWIMFSSIRPRDLLRHVCLTSHEKERCKSLEHVNRMIDHFNHVAYWVANLILLRDKPKHRARMLEKFMSIGWVSQVSECICLYPH